MHHGQMAELTIQLQRKEHTSPAGITRAFDIAVMLVDGETVADLVARTTTRTADDYRTGLPAATALSPEGDMLGQPGGLWHFFTGEPRHRPVADLLLRHRGLPQPHRRH